MMLCPRCNRPMGMRGVPSRVTHHCAFCRYTIIVSFGIASGTTITAPLIIDEASRVPDELYMAVRPIILKAQLPRSWEDPPTKTIIPRVFYEAFEGEEVEEL